MARQVKTSEVINLTLTLEKTETGKYPQATIYNSSGVELETIDLSEVNSTTYAGVYRGTYTTPSSDQDLYVIYRVFTDSGHTTLDTDAESHATDELNVVSLNFTTGTGPYSHTDTITDENSGVGIDGVNVYVYSDANMSNLIASTITNSVGVYTETLYSDTDGTHYRRLVAAGRPHVEDTVIFN